MCIVVFEIATWISQNKCYMGGSGVQTPEPAAFCVLYFLITTSITMTPG